MDGDDSKGNGETKQLKLTNNKTVSKQALHFDKFDEEDNGTSLHKSFREKSLISGFIVDRPPAKNSISYRLLHRLDLNFFDSSDGEEGYLYSDLKETKKSKQNDISQILCNYSLRDTINVLTLFLESRFAIPIYSAEIMELLKITRRIEENVFLGDDLKLPRIAILSKVKNFKSSSGKIMEGLFNLKSSFDTFGASNVEVGQGLICLEKMEKKTCVVLHIQENFQKYLNILTEFVDYLIIEDESVSRSDFVDNSEIFEASSFISKYSCEISVAKFITLWIPKASNVKNVLIDNRLCLIEGSLDSFIEIQQNHQLANILDERKCHPTPLHSLFPSDERLKPVVDSVRKIYLQVSEMDALEEYWSNSLLLQKSFINEGKLQEELNESKYANERSEINQNIFEEREFRMKHGFETDPLIMYFLESFQKNDIDETLLHHQVLDNAIAINLKRSNAHAQLPEEDSEKMKIIPENQDAAVVDSERLNRIESRRKCLLRVKEKQNNVVLSLCHLWREISLLYSSGKSEEFEYLPQRAASCLIAGETLELYDGDANMLNVEWITAVFKSLASVLPHRKLLVLSVIGEKSSGKLELLNTMFGIQYPSNVNHCASGITMTLVKTVNRQEYDYIMIFDTEGIQTQEQKGRYHSVKRDNAIITLSILLSDATILVTNGENDSNLKDLLSLVTLAYKNSKIAEEKGGLLCSKGFAACIQLKNDKSKINPQNIVSETPTNFIEFFTKTTSLKETYGTTSNGFSARFISEEDVRVFESPHKGDPPNDIPNVDFNWQIVDFREHIHKQVVSQSQWTAREIGSLENYSCLVWDCINSSDFDRSFKSLIERYIYTEIENKYQYLRKAYYEEYEEQYNLLKYEYKENFPLIEGKPMCFKEIQRLVDDLEGKMRPKTSKFEEGVKFLFQISQNQKWKIEFSRKVQDTIFLAKIHWCHKLEVVLKNYFTFGAKVKMYQNEIKDKITKEYSAKSIKEETEIELIARFDRIFDTVSKKAREENPPLEVKDAALNAYRANSTIVSLGIDLLSENEKTSFWGKLWDGAVGLIEPIVEWFAQENDIENMVVQLVHRVTSGRKYYSDGVVDNVIGEIENLIRRCNKDTNKDQRRKIHRVAYNLLINICVDIQEKWESENSASVCLESIREAMKWYSLEFSKGLEEVDIMASILSDFFARHAFKAFESEIKEIVISNLGKKRWIQSPKYVQGHMDLYLIEEVEPNGIEEVLRLIEKPEDLKELTSRRLIHFEIDSVLERLKWENFRSQLEGCLRNTFNASKDLESRSKSFNFSQLFNYLEMLKSKYIVENLKREMDAFGWEGLEAMSVQFELKHVNAIVNKFDTSFSSLTKEDIVDSVFLTLKQNHLFDSAFCTPCQEKCPLCESPCFLEFSHTGRHDAFHQPIGVVCFRYIKTKELWYHGCNSSPLDYIFVLDNGEKWKFADFSVKFDTWLQPDINIRISQYRQYLISKYNKEIAKYYFVNPSDTIDPVENLELIISKIQRNIDYFLDFSCKK